MIRPPMPKTPGASPHLCPCHSGPVCELTSFELPFSQFWRRDNLIEDGDRVMASWGAWYSATQPDASDITIGTREETEVLFGETFYTQRLVTWDLSPYATAFGVWAGIDPGRCNSSGHSQVNFLIKAAVTGVSSLTLRVKIKDAQGSYFYKDVAATANAWQRVQWPFRPAVGVGQRPPGSSPPGDRYRHPGQSSRQRRLLSH
jgi:hypothetical protein